MQGKEFDELPMYKHILGHGYDGLDALAVESADDNIDFNTLQKPLELLTGR